MSKRSNRFDRRERDFYPTPRAAVLPLIPHLRAARIRTFCEPFAGDGALVRHLETFGLVCAHSSDIATGTDARAVQSFDSPVVTNPPYARKLMHPLIWHFVAKAPCAWLLLEYDWTATKQARPFLPHCSDIVMVGRLRLIEGSPFTGLDNFAWLRFSADHRAGPILHAGDSTPPRTRICRCGDAFRPARSDARFCSFACKQRAYRERVAVTEP